MTGVADDHQITFFQIPTCSYWIRVLFILSVNNMATARLQKDVFMSVYFQAMWKQIKGTLHPELDGNSSRKRRVLEKLKKDQKKKIESMVDELSVEEIFIQIGEQLSSQFKVSLQLQIPDIQNGTQEPLSDVEENGNDLSDNVEFEQRENDHPKSKRFKWRTKEVTVEEHQRKKIDRLKQVNSEQAHTISVLREKNASLSMTSASYTHQKMVEQLGQTRSASLVDASLFSNAFHSGDCVLQKEEPIFLDESEFKGLKVTNLPAGFFCDVKRYWFRDINDSVAVKCTKTDIFGHQGISILSHEHRLLVFTGKHKNIVRTMGLVGISGVLSHVMYYQDGTRLDFMMQKSTFKNFFVFRELIEGSLVD
ncbi:uncharacterized protein [Clytia hemisphaerica]